LAYRFALAALLLPLGGCVVPPGGGYGYPAAYSQPGYPAAYPQPQYGYPGYAYNDGAPTYYVDGATVPLLYLNGGWGYWDGYHRWHGAPPEVWRHLDERHPGGVGLRPVPGGFPGPGRFVGPGAVGRPGPVGARPVAAPARGAPPARPARRDEHR